MISEYSNLSPICKKILHISRYEYINFLNKKNVIGVGLGYKECKGIDTSIPCIKVFVENKYLEGYLSRKDIIPKTYNGILTDVVESGAIEASSLTERVRPAPGGYSISNVIFKKSGTIGCLITDGKEKYILSGNHILATVNRCPVGVVILQPSATDKGKYPKDEIAALDKFIPLVPGEDKVNLVDCAIAKPTKEADVSARIALIGNIKGVRLAQVGEEVKKTGRTTELTFGKVKAIGCTFTTEIFSKKYVFCEQIAATKMSDGGDSGSVLLGKDDYVLGLLYSGTKSYSVFNAIRNVIGSLGMTIVTG